MGLFKIMVSEQGHKKSYNTVLIIFKTVKFTDFIHRNILKESAYMGPENLLRL